jgi:hypothetical protein
MLHTRDEVLRYYLRSRYRRLLRFGIPPAWIKWVIMGWITLPRDGHQVPTGLIHRNRRHMLPIWKRSLFLASMRAQPAYMIPCIIERAQVLYKEGWFQEAAAFFISCAPIIRKVLKTNHKDHSPRFQRYYSEAVDCLAETVFKSITQPCANSLSEGMVKEIFACFTDFVSIMQQQSLQDLLHQDDDVRRKAVAIAKESLFASQNMAYLISGLIAKHEKRWLDALRLFSQCRGKIKLFTTFQILCIILDGKAGKRYTREDGMRMLEKLKDDGYGPAIIYWLEDLLSRANTPQNIAEAYHKLVLCPGWEQFMPEVKWKLLAKLNHRIKLIKARLESWVKAVEEQQDRAFWHAMQEKCRPLSELSATEDRIVKNEKSVAAHQKEVAEAQSIYDELRILYETEKKAAGKKKREETNVGGKRER